MKLVILASVFVWVFITSPMNDGHSSIVSGGSSSTSSTNSLSPQRNDLAPTTQGGSPSVRSTRREFEDPIDRAIEMTVSVNKDIPDDTIFGCITELEEEEERLELLREAHIKEFKKFPEILRNRLTLASQELGALRIDWAKRLIAKASHVDLRNNETLRSHITACIAQLKMYFTYRSIHIEEPFGTEKKQELRIQDMHKDIAKRSDTQKQLEQDGETRKEVVKRIGEQHMAESKLVTVSAKENGSGPSTSSTHITSPRKDLQKKLTEKEVLAQKKEKLAKIVQLLTQCEVIDSECIPSDEQPSDADRQDLQEYYSRLQGTLECVVEQIPYKKKSPPPVQVRDIQRDYVNLLLIEQLTTQCTVKALASLSALQRACIKNRQRMIDQEEAGRKKNDKEYGNLHDERDAQKVLLDRLEKLMGKELEPTQVERLKRAEAFEKTK